MLSAYEENIRRPTSLDYSTLQKISTDNKNIYFQINFNSYVQNNILIVSLYPININNQNVAMLDK